MKNDTQEYSTIVAASEEEGAPLASSKAEMEVIAESNVSLCVLSDVAFERVLRHENVATLLADEQFRCMLGNPQEKLQGNDIATFTIAPESRALVEDMVAKRSTRPCEAIGQRRDGSRFPMEIRAHEVTHGGRSVRVVCIVDLSERRALEKRLERVTSNERELLVRELHDGVCQDLGAVSFLTAELAMKLKATSFEGKEILGKILSLVRSAIGGARNIGRSMQFVFSSSSGLRSGLEHLAEKTAALTTATCRFVCEGAGLVPYRRELDDIYLIAQEAAINAAKHAEASTILINLSVQSGVVEVCVEDDGKGIPLVAYSHKYGMGLGIMPRRAQSIGAMLEIDDRPLGGTCVRCRWDTHLASGES